MKNVNEDFFIGWKGNVSAGHKQWIKRILIPVFILIPILIYAIVIFGKPFGLGQFELGNVKTFTGVYYENPFPVLLLDEGQLESGTGHAALLVGFGKNGAKTFIQQAEESKGQLSGKHLKIQGTLIYGDGKTLIELTKKEDSVVEILGEGMKLPANPKTTAVNLQGEILDPKCWFGVMKPAEGKVHKSCAIRCISGGIPPVLRAKKGSANVYYVLKGLEGEDINQDVLEFVGEPININGESYIENGWHVLEVDPSEIRYLE